MYYSLKLTLIFIASLFSTVIQAQDTSGITVQGPKKSDIRDTYALIVGISEYQSNPKIPNLKFADDDAQAVAAYLKSKSGGSVPAGQITELYNLKATNGAIMNAFRMIDAKVQNSPAEIKKDDRLIIYLAGHGGAFNVQDSYFFPTNADNAQDAGVAISIRTIKNYMENWRLKGINVILIFDACRSATIGMGEDGIRKVSEYLEEKRNGEILMVASSKGQEALELDSISHGLFTYYLLAGLYGMADKNNDQEIKGYELAGYLEENIATHSNNRQFPFIDFDDWKNATLAVIDPAEKEIMLKSFHSKNILAAVKPASTNTSLQSRNAAGSGSNAAFLKLENDFRTALHSSRLTYPENDCATYFFKKLVGMDPKNKSLDAHKFELSSALLNAAQQVLLNDIGGLRLYTRSDPAHPSRNRREGYNLDYYADAILALQQYSMITKSPLDQELSCLNSYLMARDLLIRSVGIPPSEIESNMEEGVAILEGSLQKCPGKAYIYQALAQTYQTRGKFKEAIELCRRSMALAPKWSFPNFTLGSLSENRDSSIYYNEKASRVNPLDIYPITALGDIYSDKREFQKALGYYLRAYQKDTLQPRSADQVAAAYLDLNMAPQAKKFIDYSIHLDKGLSWTYVLKGSYFQIQGNLDSSLYCFKYAVKINPYDGDFHSRAGYVLLAMGRRDEALQYALRSVDLDPRNAWAHFMVGQCYQSQNLNELALDSYNKAMELDPTEGKFKETAAILCYNMKDYDQAIKLFTNGKNVYSYMMIGESYMAQGKLDLAEQSLNQAHSLSANDVATNYVLSRLMAKKGQVQNAIRYLRVSINGGMSTYGIRDVAEYASIWETKEFRKFLRELRLE